MLAWSGRLPTRGDWAYEVKWDGFRALVSTEAGLRVRTRRGWNITELIPTLRGMPFEATPASTNPDAPTRHSRRADIPGERCDVWEPTRVDGKGV
jgi:hypothetical protein